MLPIGMNGTTIKWSIAVKGGYTLCVLYKPNFEGVITRDRGNQLPISTYCTTPHRICMPSESKLLLTSEPIPDLECVIIRGGDDHAPTSTHRTTSHHICMPSQ